jgi:hypothetical protein
MTSKSGAKIRAIKVRVCLDQHVIPSKAEERSGATGKYGNESCSLGDGEEQFLAWMTKSSRKPLVRRRDRSTPMRFARDD